MNSNPFFFWVYDKCQGLVRQHILYGSINLAWRLKFNLQWSKLGTDGSTQRLWMAMQISLASFIHAKVGAFNHCITSHISLVSCLVNLCRLQSFGGSHRRPKSWYLEDSLWDLTQKETCRWLQWQAVFGFYAPGQMSLHWFNIMYIVLIICYIYTHMSTFLQLNPSEFWCQRWRSLLQDVQHGSQAGLASSAGEQRKTQLCARSTCRRLKKQSH